MIISFYSEINEKFYYDIYENEVLVKSIAVVPNKRTDVHLEIGEREADLWIKPCKNIKKIKTFRLFKTLITVFLSYFLFAITWESGFMPSNQNFHFICNKRLKIKNYNKSKLEFKIISGKAFEANDLFEFRINIIRFENLDIKNQTSEIEKDFKYIKKQFYNWILFYSLWFLPAIVIFLILAIYGVWIENIYFCTLGFVLFGASIILCSVCLIRCSNVYKQYKLF